jgi:hypothetical protein
MIFLLTEVDDMGISKGWILEGGAKAYRYPGFSNAVTVSHLRFLSFDL